MLTGCKGYPEPTQGGSFGMDFLPKFKDTQMRADRFTELNQDQPDDLAIRTLFSASFDTIVARTPGNFKVTYPMQMALIDWIFLALELYLSAQNLASRERRASIPLGTFMPYFYSDFTRTYAIIPGFYESEARRSAKARREDVLGYRAVRGGRARAPCQVPSETPAGPRA